VSKSFGFQSFCVQEFLQRGARLSARMSVLRTPVRNCRSVESGLMFRGLRRPFQLAGLFQKAPCEIERLFERADE
jgi:hypothetical protein